MMKSAFNQHFSEIARLMLGIFVCNFLLCSSATAADPLPSWNESESKKAIIALLRR